MKNVLVNVTVPVEVAEYLDEKAEELYITRATIARKFLIEHIEEVKVTEAREKGFSIRKVADMTRVRYDKVLEILRRTGVDAKEEKELEDYMDKTVEKLKKRK